MGSCSRLGVFFKPEAVEFWLGICARWAQGLRVGARSIGYYCVLGIGLYVWWSVSQCCSNAQEIIDVEVRGTLDTYLLFVAGYLGGVPLYIHRGPVPIALYYYLYYTF